MWSAAAFCARRCDAPPGVPRPAGGRPRQVRGRPLGRQRYMGGPPGGLRSRRRAAAAGARGAGSRGPAGPIRVGSPSGTSGGVLRGVHADGERARLDDPGSMVTQPTPTLSAGQSTEKSATRPCWESIENATLPPPRHATVSTVGSSSHAPPDATPPSPVHSGTHTSPSGPGCGSRVSSDAAAGAAAPTAPATAGAGIPPTRTIPAPPALTCHQQTAG